MVLRRRLQLTPETVGDVDLAADARYRDGAALLAQGHHLAAIYLLGYAAEMILKHACFRTDRGRPGDPAAGFFGPTRTWMKLRHPLVDREGYHSLLFWMLYLRSRRRQIGMPLAQELDWELVACVRRLYQSWSIDLRYRPWLATAVEARAVYNHVTWLRQVRIRLWS